MKKLQFDWPPFPRGYAHEKKVFPLFSPALMTVFRTHGFPCLQSGGGGGPDNNLRHAFADSQRSALELRKLLMFVLSDPLFSSTSFSGVASDFTTRLLSLSVPELLLGSRLRCNSELKDLRVLCFFAFFFGLAFVIRHNVFWARGFLAIGFRETFGGLDRMGEDEGEFGTGGISSSKLEFDALSATTGGPSLKKRVMVCCRLAKRGRNCVQQAGGCRGCSSRV